MTGKLRRSIAVREQGRIFYFLINGKPRTVQMLEEALRIVENKPIVGPLAVWYVAGSSLVCIGEVGAWQQEPIAYGRWADLFPVFEAYARML